MVMTKELEETVVNKIVNDKEVSNLIDDGEFNQAADLFIERYCIYDPGPKPFLLESMSCKQNRYWFSKEDFLDFLSDCGIEGVVYKWLRKKC